MEKHNVELIRKPWLGKDGKYHDAFFLQTELGRIAICTAFKQNKGDYYLLKALATYEKPNQPLDDERQ